MYGNVDNVLYYYAIIRTIITTTYDNGLLEVEKVVSISR